METVKSTANGPEREILGIPAADEGPGTIPPSPEQLDQTGVDPQVLRDLLLRLSYTVPTFSTKWAAEQSCLPMNLVEELCWKLKQDHLLEILGQDGPLNYSYSATQRGREQALRLLEFCGYIGPAPVSLQAYTEMLQRQNQVRQQISLEDVRSALAELVLPDDAVEVAALAALSGRSLFLFGPPGNGKTTLGRVLHTVFGGQLWIPQCIDVGGSIIRIFDPQVHHPCEIPTDGKWDRRWVLVHRPFIVAGGEMTMEELDLAFSPSLRFYEAPPHVKANGGTFLIDDFGRQRIEPHELLNRWIIPLESRIDHLSLHTGQKIQVPFELMLIVATNLKVSEVADPAFLRRMGYRLHLDYPTVDNYQRIFERYARSRGATVPAGLIAHLLKRYSAENRQLRASEPRDLIERARDICNLRHHEFQLSEDIMDVAWRGYFGTSQE